MEKRQLESDKKLIKVLFNLEPMDWSRRDNGELVFLTFSGQKFVYSPEELSELQDKALDKRDRSQPRSDPQERSAEIREVKRPQAAVTEGNSKNDQVVVLGPPQGTIKPKSHHKIVVEDKSSEV